MLDKIFGNVIIDSMTKDLKQRIIAATIEIGAKQGINNISNSSISARCKISSAAIYYHFKNKYELILESTLYVARLLSDSIITSIDYSKGYEENYKSALRASIYYQLKNKSKCLFYYNISMSPTNVIKPSYQEAVADFCPITKLIKQGVSTGAIRKSMLSVTVIGYSPIYLYVINCHKFKISPKEAEVDEFIEMIWNAIKAC